MSKHDARKLTNSFQDVRLVSLAGWSKAAEIIPKDRNGPYVVLQEGYAPEDVTMTPAEYVLGRSGSWLPLHTFYKLPVPERRAEFIFGTAGEVMSVVGSLPGKVTLFGSSAVAEQGADPAEPDEMAKAIQAANESQ